MKKALILMCSFSLLFSLNCATTEQEVSKTEEPTQEVEETKEMVTGDFDLTGTWKVTAIHRGCNDNKTIKSTLEITQKGNSVTIVDNKTDWRIIGTINNDIIFFPAFKEVAKSGRGTNEFQDAKFKIAGDANSFAGKVKWTYHGTEFVCDGTSNITYKRKLK
jgi:hypothetical protein